MEPAGIKDTTAYKIIRQVTDHIWGSDEELSDEKVAAICRLYAGRGASWEALMNGSMDSAVQLEHCIEAVVKFTRNGRIASRVARSTRRVR